MSGRRCRPLRGPDDGHHVARLYAPLPVAVLGDDGRQVEGVPNPLRRRGVHGELLGGRVQPEIQVVAAGQPTLAVRVPRRARDDQRPGLPARVRDPDDLQNPVGEVGGVGGPFLVGAQFDATSSLTLALAVLAAACLVTAAAGYAMDAPDGASTAA